MTPPEAPESKPSVPGDAGPGDAGRDIDRERGLLLVAAGLLAWATVRCIIACG
jgi:hypothetical protein